MRYVSLPCGGPQVSVLGLGCAAMLGRSGRQESLAALSAAYDAGITFYDTARSYGYGESEVLLGEFFAGRRDSVVLCTKFGILPAPPGGWKQKLKPLARSVVRLFPGLRSAVRKQAADQMVQGQFSVEVLRASVETSLRSLKTDYVDMLLMHAAPISVLQQDDLLDEMGRLVEQGKVRMAGISGEHNVIAGTFTQRPSVLTTAQFAVNISNLKFTRHTLPAAEAGMFLVANHPFGGPMGVDQCRRRIEEMRVSEELPITLREKLTADAQLMPEVVLNVILSGTGISAVIPAMMQTSHLAGNVRAVEECRFSAEEIALLRHALER